MMPVSGAIMIAGSKTPGGKNNMLTLLVGFVGMVFVPALILSLVLTRLKKKTVEFLPQEDNLPFRMSSDIK